MLRIPALALLKVHASKIVFITLTLFAMPSLADITANDDIRQVPQGTAVVIAVLNNDTSTEPGLRIARFIQPANGIVTAEDGALRYQPDAGFSGQDTFAYTIVNDAGEEGTAQVNVNVQPVEGAVVASTIEDAAPRAAATIMRSHRDAVMMFMEVGSFASLNGRSSGEQEGDGAGDGFENFKLGGFFASINHRGGQQDAKQLQAAYKDELTGVTLGADLAWGPVWTAGVALGVSDAQIDSAEDSSDFDVKDTSLLGFSSYRGKQLTVFAQVGYSMLAYDFQKANSDGNNLFFIASTQYAWQYQAWQFIPALSLSYQNSFVDAYTEQGDNPTSFSSQKSRALQAGISVHVDRVFNFSWGVLLPRISLATEQVVTAGERDVTGFSEGQAFALLASEQNQSRVLLEVGSSAVLPNGISIYANIQHVAQQEGYSSDTLQLGFRKEI